MVTETGIASMKKRFFILIPLLALAVSCGMTTEDSGLKSFSYNLSKTEWECTSADYWSGKKGRLEITSNTITITGPVNAMYGYTPVALSGYSEKTGSGYDPGYWEEGLIHIYDRGEWQSGIAYKLWTAGDHTKMLTLAGGSFDETTLKEYSGD
jgi:hypothetical protein